MSMIQSDHHTQKGIQSQIYQQLAQQNIADMPNNIQQILPALSQLNDTDYNYLYNLLTKLNKDKNGLDAEKDISRLGNGYFGKVTISDDFTDELGDESY
ncbi:MAG: hypothetical protein CR966_01365 [Pseudomonadales bacterium]|nr:MAG: hypothetical protein CR966_01365 [Pseudomonadales bacterium]